MKHAPRAVLDTNVVLSALLFASGRLAPIRLAWQSKTFCPLVSRATTEELIRVLSYPKFRLTDAERDELIADYLPQCKVVIVPTKAPPQSWVMPKCRDPFDLPFLHLAKQSKADYLVTGDRDLLALKGQLSCAIVSPDEFMSLLGISLRQR